MHVGSTLGVQVWHVKGNRPVVWPPKNYGIFLSGECFIVLNTTKNADGALRYEVSTGNLGTIACSGTRMTKTIKTAGEKKAADGT